MRPGAVKLIRWAAQPESVEFLDPFGSGQLITRAGVVVFFVGFVERVLFLHRFVKGGTKQETGHVVFCVDHIGKRVEIDGGFRRRQVALVHHAL